MTQTPADLIATATAQLRHQGEQGLAEGYDPQIPAGAVIALADWLSALADMAVAYPEMAHDHDRPACDDYACDVMGRGIALAQILGTTEQPAVPQPTLTGAQFTAGLLHTLNTPTDDDHEPYSYTDSEGHRLTLRPRTGMFGNTLIVVEADDLALGGDMTNVWLITGQVADLSRHLSDRTAYETADNTGDSLTVTATDHGITLALHRTAVDVDMVDTATVPVSIPTDELAALIAAVADAALALDGQPTS